MTRRQQPKLPWFTPAVYAGRKCLTLKPSSSTSKANIQSLRCPRSWSAWRHNTPTSTNETSEADSGQTLSPLWTHTIECFRRNICFSGIYVCLSVLCRNCMYLLFRLFIFSSPDVFFVLFFILCPNQPKFDPGLLPKDGRCTTDHFASFLNSLACRVVNII